jgi:hypothetical protein
MSVQMPQMSVQMPQMSVQVQHRLEMTLRGVAIPAAWAEWACLGKARSMSPPSAVTA